jgi:iron(III) transport system permease protein
MVHIAHPIGRYRGSFGVEGIVYWTVLALTFILVLYPVALVILGSFRAGSPGQAPVYNLDGWRFALSDPNLIASVWNTLALTIVRQLIAFVVAIPIAWLLARTDLPGSRWLEFSFWMAFFLPTLPVLLGWIMLLDPQYGLINLLVKAVFPVKEGPFDIYSFWGIVWVHLVTGSVPFKVMLLTLAFRNMDASLEEAANVSGANNVRTLIQIVLPAMAPMLTIVLLLAIIHSLQAFEIELVLGLPIRFFVFSSLIYHLLSQEPPLFTPATALSCMTLALLVPLIIVQRWVSTRRSYATVGGQFRGNKIALRKWRLPAFFFIVGIAMLVTATPIVFLVLGTFMKLFGFFSLPEPWTTAHWSRVAGDPIFLRSLWNTLLLAGGAAVLSVTLCTIVAYIIVRTRFAARAALDFVSWLPVTLPGIILGLGLLTLFLGSPLLRPLYGTLSIMVIASLIGRMTTSVQIIKGNLTQLGNDIEEAARVNGGSWWQAFTAVLLPLIIPSLLLVGTLTFIAAARDVSNVVLLATNATRPLAILQLDFMVDGRYESGAVVGVILVVLTTGAALIGRICGLRIGLTS